MKWARSHLHWDTVPGVASHHELPFRDRAANYLKAAFGTWTLLGLVIAFIVFWLLAIHDPGELRLNLGLSFLASVQGVILQIAANRGDRIASEVALHTEQNTQKLVGMNETQLQILNELRGIKGALEETAQDAAAATPEVTP